MNEIIVCRDCASSDCTGCNMLVLHHALERNRFEALMNGNRHLSIDTDVVPVRHGQWIGIYNDLTCSCCNQRWDEWRAGDANDWGYWEQKPSYCPNCGAKMDGDIIGRRT